MISYLIFSGTIAGFYALLSLGLVTAWGQGGLVNLGLVGFVGLGAYTSALLSGGSSVGQEDHAPRVVAREGELRVHGVALRPASPAGVGFVRGKPVFLMPGNPVSCMVTYDLFVAPTLAYLSGAVVPPRRSVSARLTRNIASATGREDYVQVRLESDAHGGLDAVPVFGKSNLIFTLIRADGMLKVPLDAGGLNAGAQVEVVLF